MMDINTISYENLDDFFIGTLSLSILDDYHQVKSGTSSYTGSVRSKVDKNKGIVYLISYLPIRGGTNKLNLHNIKFLNGRITERFKTSCSSSSIQNITSIYLRDINTSQIREAEIVDKDKNILTFKHKCEFDDVLFNLNDEDFTFDVTYYIKKNKIGLYFHALVIEIPITKFNLYIEARNNWYRHYAGCTTIING